MAGVVPWLRRVGFRTRLSTLTAVAVGLAIALASIASYEEVHHQLYAQVDSSLTTATASVYGRITAGPYPAIDSSDYQRGNAIANRDDDVIQVINSQGAILYPVDGTGLPFGARQRAIAATATSGNVDPNDPTDYVSISEASFRGVQYRVATIPLGQDANGNGVALQLYHNLATTTHPLRVMRLVLLIVVLAGIGLAVGMGLLLATTTIRPVMRLTRAAEHVASTQDLDATIDEQGNDELARLAHAFNDMLGALRASRQQQAQLVSDAGHELRTPLTSLRTNIEVLMRVQDLPADDREALLTDVSAQVEELTTLIGDVVELARQDERQTEPTEVRLDRVVSQAVARAERRASGVDWQVALTPGSVRAQPALLERAVLNVLDNASKWSPTGSTIHVNLARLDRWHLDVRDEGPGIAEGDLPHVFDRFYRAPSARSMPGSGLGLAIVHQVVTAHGGTVAVASPEDGGTLVHIELPIVTEAEPEPEPDRVPGAGLEPAHPLE